MNWTGKWLPGLPGLPGVLVLALALSGVARGQMDEDPGSGATESITTEPGEAPAGEATLEPDEAEATQAMQDMLGERESSPVIEPTRTPSPRTPSPRTPNPGAGATAAASTEIDPAVLGIAPGEDPPPLRREGEFIVNRRGRLIRSSESGHPLFVFESDSEHAPELPMVLQACQLLETMEDTVDRRGDGTVFILSGQVHAYRGANYLTPTMMKIAVDTGNLTN